MSNEKDYIPTKAILEVVLLKDSESFLAESLSKDDNLPRLTAQDVQERFVTLERAKEELGIAHLAYVRRLVKENKLEGIKVSVPGGSRWLVTKASISSYSKRVVRSRELRNYILRIPEDKEGAVRAALKANGIKFNLELAYESKPKSTKPGEAAWASVISSLS